MATPQNQKKIEWLSRFRKSEQELSRLYGELERWNSKAEKVTQRISPMPPGARSGDKVQDCVELISAVKRNINREIVKQCHVRNDITAAIESVSDETLRLLLELRYIDGLTWEKIAVKLNYSYMHICRLHGKAISQLVIECYTRRAV